MKNDLVTFIESFVIGDYEEEENLAVFPIYAEGNGEKFITLEEGLKKNLIKITEVSDTGSVPTLRVINFSTQYLVIFVGEMLIGAKQNRVVNTTIVIKPHSELEIPVSCVEEGRWSYQKGDFSGFDSYAYSDLRKEIVRDVSMNMKRNGKVSAQQSKVWDMVSDKLDDLKVLSNTGSLDEAYNAKRFNRERFIKKFKEHKKQIGAFILINKEFQVMEVCSNPVAFKNIYSKLINSVSLDAMNNREKKTNSATTNIHKELSRVLGMLKESEVSAFKGVGEGKDLRIEGKNILGSAVKFNDSLLHLTVFSSEKNNRTRRREWSY